MAEGKVQKRVKLAFSSTEKVMMCNMFNTFKIAIPTASHNELCKTVAQSLGIHWCSVYKVLKERETNKRLKSPTRTKARLKICDKVDEFTKCAIRIIVHNFFLNNEIPTLDKVLQKIEENDSFTFKRTSLNRILKNIGFKFYRRGNNSILNDRDDIFLWRRSYLRTIKNAREAGRKIYYLDETWLNEGHAISKSCDAFVKNPSGKGKRLIITHIGSEEGFVEGALHVFESKKQGDYHLDEDMNAENFEKWFIQIIDKLPENAVIVMDNATYHSRKVEKIPNAMSKKQVIIDWLKEKSIEFEENLLKRELLAIVKEHRKRYEAYVIDEIAKTENKTVLRLPPFHSELNPIELIWAQIKGDVASSNTTFNMVDLKTLFYSAVKKITPEKWKECVKHVEQVIEPKMNEMDHNFEGLSERFITNVGNKEDEDVSSDTSESDI